MLDRPAYLIPQKIVFLNLILTRSYLYFLFTIFPRLGEKSRSKHEELLYITLLKIFSWINGRFIQEGKKECVHR